MPAGRHARARNHESLILDTLQTLSAPIPPHLRQRRTERPAPPIPKLEGAMPRVQRRCTARELVARRSISVEAHAAHATRDVSLHKVRDKLQDIVGSPKTKASPMGSYGA